MGVVVLYCDNCGHERGSHIFGVCRDVISGCGPSDNMDVWEYPCDCGQYQPEYDAPDYGEVFEWA